MSEPDAVQCPTCGTTLQEQTSGDNSPAGQAERDATVSEAVPEDPVAVALPTEGIDLIDRDFIVRSR